MQLALDSLLGPHTHRDKPLSRIMCVRIPPYLDVSNYENLTPFYFSEFFLIGPRGVKGKKVRTTLDDVGGKSVNEKSKSTGGKCVSENSTWETWCDTDRS